MTHGTMRLPTTRVLTTRLVASFCVWSALCGGLPLAAQDTIANLFGSIVVAIDQ